MIVPDGDEEKFLTSIGHNIEVHNHHITGQQWQRRRNARLALAGYSSYNQNKGMAEQAEADGKAQLARGRLEAERIRKEGKRKAQSAARAAALKWA